MLSFQNLTHRIHSAKEEFCISIPTEKYIPTNKYDNTRTDYDVIGPYGTTKFVTINTNSTNFQNDLHNFIDNNIEQLQTKYLHVTPTSETKRNLGISDFPKQPQKEIEFIPNQPLPPLDPNYAVPNIPDKSTHSNTIEFF